MTYSEFINNIIETRGQGNIPEGDYFEVHHIIPRCMGGEPQQVWRHNTKHENLIGLYPQEHFLAHQLLYEENKDNIHILRAYGMICRGLYKRGEVSPENYSKIKQEGYTKVAKAPKSEEHRIKIGEAHKGVKRLDLSEYNSTVKKGSKDSYETHLKKCKAQSGENNSNSKKVINLDTNEVFGYTGLAAKSVNGSVSGLSTYLHNNSRRGITQYKGYRGDGYNEF